MQVELVSGQVGIGFPGSKCSALEYMWVHEPNGLPGEHEKMFNLL
jgi:hypothetical protein